MAAYIPASVQSTPLWKVQHNGHSKISVMNVSLKIYKSIKTTFIECLKYGRYSSEFFSNFISLKSKGDKAAGKVLTVLV